MFYRNISDRRNVNSRSFFLDDRLMNDLQLIDIDKVYMRFTPNVLVRMEW